MDSSEKPLVEGEFVLEKFPGKGGWTYARLSQIKYQKGNPFGWLQVRGQIDEVFIEKYHLMPMGDGHLFLPIKAAIRKKIKKEAGDSVQIVLYREAEWQEIPAEFWDCLDAFPETKKGFQQKDREDQLTKVNWVYSAKTEKEKEQRISRILSDLEKEVHKI